MHTSLIWVCPGHAETALISAHDLFKLSAQLASKNQAKDGSRYGRNTEANFRYLSNYEKCQKVV